MKWNKHLSYAQIVILLSNLNQLPTFYPLCFPCPEMSESSFNVKWFFVCLFFASTTSSGTLLSFCYNHFPLLGNQSLKWSVAAFFVYMPMPGKSSMPPFTFDYRLHLWCHHVLFLCSSFIFVGQCSFEYPCYMNISLGDKKATQPHSLLSVHELDNKCVVTNH